MVTIRGVHTWCGSFWRIDNTKNVLQVSFLGSPSHASSLFLLPCSSFSTFCSGLSFTSSNTLSYFDSQFLSFSYFFTVFISCLEYPLGWFLIQTLQKSFAWSLMNTLRSLYFCTLVGCHMGSSWVVLVITLPLSIADLESFYWFLNIPCSARIMTFSVILWGKSKCHPLWHMYSPPFLVTVISSVCLLFLNISLRKLLLLTMMSYESCSQPYTVG